MAIENLISLLSLTMMQAEPSGSELYPHLGNLPKNPKQCCSNAIHK